jgi:hypothetical protein
LRLLLLDDRRDVGVDLAFFLYVLNNDLTLGAHDVFEVELRSHVGVAQLCEELRQIGLRAEAGGETLEDFDGLAFLVFWSLTVNTTRTNGLVPFCVVSIPKSSTFVTMTLCRPSDAFSYSVFLITTLIVPSFSAPSGAGCDLLSTYKAYNAELFLSIDKFSCAQ